MNHRKTYNQLAGQRIQRTEAISDGVFAIALTLLVLDLKVPIGATITTESALLGSLLNLMPKLLSYFLSFMTLGIFWIGHAAQLHYIKRSDRHLSWISLFFLMFVSLLPFTTAFLSEYIHFKVAVGLYWLNILALGGMLYIHWSYAERHHYLDPDLTEHEKASIGKAIKQRIVIAQTLYGLGAVLCFINTYFSIIVIVLVQLNYALAFFQKLEHPKQKSQDDSPS